MAPVLLAPVLLLHGFVLQGLLACGDGSVEPAAASGAAETAADVGTARASSPTPPVRSDAEPTFNQGPLDGMPGRTVAGPRGGTAVVQPGGDLQLVDADGGPHAVDTEVDHRVAFSPDGAWLYYSRQGGLVETDLWRVALDGRGAPAASPEQVTAWRGSEDRVVLSPDGTRAAFVSGRTGLAAWWVVDLDGPLPVAEDAGQQVSNVALVKVPGRPPLGWTPPPEGHDYAWTAEGITWVAEGQRFTVDPAQGGSP